MTVTRLFEVSEIKIFEKLHMSPVCCAASTGRGLVKE